MGGGPFAFLDLIISRYTLILSTGQSESSSASNSITMRNKVLSTVKVGRDAPEGILKELSLQESKYNSNEAAHKNGAT